MPTRQGTEVTLWPDECLVVGPAAFTPGELEGLAASDDAGCAGTSRRIPDGRITSSVWRWCSCATVSSALPAGGSSRVGPAGGRRRRLERSARSGDGAGPRRRDH